MGHKVTSFCVPARLLSQLVFSLATIYFCSQCLVKYLNFEVGTRVDYVPTEDTAFPALTICWKIGYKRSFSRSYGIKKIASVLEEGNFPSNLTMYEFLNSTRFKIEEFLMNITFETFNKVDEKYLHLYWMQNDTDNRPDFKVAAMASEGLCYTMVIPDKYSKAGISSVNMNFYSHPDFDMETGTDFREIGWRVYMHYPGQLRRGTPVSGGCKTGYGTTLSVAHELFRKLNNSDECNSNMNRRFDTCWETNLKQKMIQSLKCFFPWNKNILEEKDEEMFCRDKKLYVNNVEKSVKASLRDTKNEQNQSICTLPCEMMRFFTTTPIEQMVKDPKTGRKQKDDGFLKLHFDEEVRVTNEFYVYDGLSMVGEAGGYLGLFLGISCYQAFHTIITYFARKNTNVNENTTLRV